MRMMLRLLVVVLVLLMGGTASTMADNIHRSHASKPAPSKSKPSKPKPNSTRTSKPSKSNKTSNQPIKVGTSTKIRTEPFNLSTVNVVSAPQLTTEISRPGDNEQTLKSVMFSNQEIKPFAFLGTELFAFGIDDGTLFNFKALEQPPQFPGGDAALMKYLGSHVQYPALAAEQGVEGRCVLQFVVTKTGSIGEVKVARSLSPECDKEAIRVCKSLPRFTPGRQNGQAVSVWYTMPVTFKLQK